MPERVTFVLFKGSSTLLDDAALAQGLRLAAAVGKSENKRIQFATNDRELDELFRERCAGRILYIAPEQEEMAIGLARNHPRCKVCLIAAQVKERPPNLVLLSPTLAYPDMAHLLLI